jgi:osmotically inducible lipoprotein OsmB
MKQLRILATILFAACTALVSGCTVGGAVAGGVIGHETTHSTAGTVGGAALGGIIGHEIGEH